MSQPGRAVFFPFFSVVAVGGVCEVEVTARAHLQWTPPTLTHSYKRVLSCEEKREMPHLRNIAMVAIGAYVVVEIVWRMIARIRSPQRQALDASSSSPAPNLVPMLGMMLGGPNVAQRLGSFRVTPRHVTGAFQAVEHWMSSQNIDSSSEEVEASARSHEQTVALNRRLRNEVRNVVHQLRTTTTTSPPVAQGEEISRNKLDGQPKPEEARDRRRGLPEAAAADDGEDPQRQEQEQETPAKRARTSPDEEKASNAQ